MNLNEYTSYDAVGLAELVARGEVSAAELADAAQRALQAVNPRINAVVEHWAPEEADLARARAGGPLAGVPFLIKDLGISMAGRRSESGSRLAVGVVADADSMLMTRFRQAGLVTLGRSTTPEMAFSTTTESVQQGATGNPWQPALTAGGSSGGAAAAVAAGIVPVAHATDAAGSIRIPAAHTGVFGLKPTRGRSSNGPGMDEVFAGFGVQLGVSRTVRDSAALLDAVQGTPAGEPYHTAAPEQGFLREVGRDPGRLKIALMAHPWNGARSQTAMVDAVEQVGRHLQGLGHNVEPAQAPLDVSWEAFVHANAQIWTTTLVNWMDAIAQAAGRPLDASTLEPATLASYTYGLRVSGVDYIRALDVRNRVTRALGAWFQQYDVLLSPTLPELPLPLGVYSQGAETMDGLAWTGRVFRHAPFSPAFNVAGLPAMSMPLVVDEASGLPIGIQFGAGFAREDMLLRLAGQLEQSMPWIGRKPLVWAGNGR